MRFKKLINRFTLVPAGTIDIQPNSVSFQPPVKVAQNVEKSLSITPLCLDHTIASKQRIDPAGDIQADTMLACRGNLQTFSFLRPPSAQSRMHRKSRFILKYDGLVWLEGLKFFLTPAGISVLLGSVLEDTNNLPALADTQDGASIVGLVAPLSLFRRIALDESPPLARPTVHGLIQIPAETSLSVLQGSVVSSALTVKSFPLWAWVSKTLHRLCSPRESNGSSSSESSRTPQLSTLDVALQVLKEGRLSLYRSKLPVFDQLWLVIVLYWRLYALNSMWGSSCPYNNKFIQYCHFI
jgi:hypothetical protein